MAQRFPGRGPGKIKDFTAAEIATPDAGSWFGAKWAGARVPTLNRVDDNGQKLLLEIKKPEAYPGIEKDTLRVLREEGWPDHLHIKHRLVIQSFGADSVKAVHPAAARHHDRLPRYARGRGERHHHQQPGRRTGRGGLNRHCQCPVVRWFA